MSRQIWWKADDSTINKLNCRPSNVGSHENTDTPVFILYSKTSNLPPSEISPPQQTSSNTASSHSIRSSNHNLIKLENNGTNVCWLNCVFQILFHTEKIHNQNSFTEDHYDYDDAIYNFIQYHINHQTTQMNLNNPVINNPENNTNHISFKQIFSLLVQRNEYATTAQQDPMEGLDLLLGVSRHFRYFAFREMHTYACPMCGLQIHDVNGPEVTNILRLPVHNDHAIHLGESIKQYFSPKPMTESNCPNNQCPSQNRTSTYVITKAPTFLIIQLLIFDRRLRKKNITCTDFMFIEIPVSEYSHGNISNKKLEKYSLEGIVEHYGNSIGEGHYISFIKEQQKWFKCDDSTITERRVLTEKPYFLVYRKV